MAREARENHLELVDGPYDAGDPMQVAARTRASKRRKKKDADYLKHILRTPEGRHWLWSLLSETNCFAEPFDLNDRCEAFKLGQYNVGKRLYDRAMSTDPKAFLLMITEQGGINA